MDLGSLNVGTPPWIRNLVSLPPATDSETGFLRPSGAFSPQFGKETRFLDFEGKAVHPFASHGLTKSIPQSKKSRVLRVANVAW